MSLLDDMKAKADANADGMLSAEDLASFQEQMPADMFEQLQAKLDGNGDGALDLNDLGGIDLGGLDFGGIAEQAKSFFDGIFGGR